ncbi:EAL domain-containing protein [Vibrio sp.]|nr:EAL domain-containing protein [Vibrio sp.]
MNILLVDDSHIDREVIKLALSEHAQPYQIQESDSVAMALNCLSNSSFDLILLDYNLIDGEGSKVLNMLIEQREKYHSAPVIMLSHFERSEIAIKCIQLGAEDFLIKKEATSDRLRRAIFQATTRYSLKEKLTDSLQLTRELAERDQLTNLMNRWVFENAVEQDIANSNGMFIGSLLIFDVDNFKHINDTYGHYLGDAVLKFIASSFQSLLNEEEHFSRLGGDEFAIFLQDDPTFIRTKHIIELMKEQLLEDVVVLGVDLNLSVSIGAFSGNQLEEEISKSKIMRYADIAMYRSKLKKGTVSTYYDTAFQDELDNKKKMLALVDEAIDTEAFYLEYQPIINRAGESISGCEVLIRGKVGEVQLRPDIFIPIAEETNRIDIIGRWVIKTAFEQYHNWKNVLPEHFILSINLSVKQLLKPTFLGWVKKTLRQYEIEADKIEFEVTETAVIDDIDLVSERLNELREVGFHIALDDFGTGYSSISHLSHLPFDTIKVDKSIVPTDASTEKQLRLFKSLVQLIKNLECTSIVEGVETKLTVQICRMQEVDLLQGYYFSRPVSADNFAEQYLH